ncbi:hypothetical protein C8J56DRAFT_892033 [Mycena floridula]|nr:hypothetical protein C8J56DRAFT_892033 [Mycena floridula]
MRTSIKAENSQRAENNWWIPAAGFVAELGLVDNDKEWLDYEKLRLPKPRQLVDEKHDAPRIQGCMENGIDKKRHNTNGRVKRRRGGRPKDELHHCQREAGFEREATYRFSNPSAMSYLSLALVVEITISTLVGLLSIHTVAVQRPRERVTTGRTAASSVPRDVGLVAHIRAVNAKKGLQDGQNESLRIKTKQDRHTVWAVKDEYIQL